MSEGQAIFQATAVSGTLDILSAFLFSGIRHVGPISVLQSVASGPLGVLARTAPAFALVGLIVHYAIMGCMAAAFCLAAARRDILVRQPIVAGAAYGILLWLVMYWIVLPLRFGIGLPRAPLPIAQQLFSHIICVGIPIALIAARRVKRL